MFHLNCDKHIYIWISATRCTFKTGITVFSKDEFEACGSSHSSGISIGVATDEMPICLFYEPGAGVNGKKYMIIRNGGSACSGRSCKVVGEYIVLKYLQWCNA